MKALMAFSLLLAVTACSHLSSVLESNKTVVTPAAVAAAKSTDANSYILQPGDLLTISVWKEKDLQGDVSIRPDGGLDFPLVNDVTAAGKTVEQLRQDIAAKLVKYIPDPVVSVILKESLGYQIFVIGKVNKPGNFPSARNIDVMQALSLAGGPTPYASLNNIKILRRVNGALKAIPFKYSKIEEGENLEQDIILQGGDVVVVP
ncbi:MAG: polysaccharide biosynthesis/export family protein [Sulfuricaulis sp.]